MSATGTVVWLDIPCLDLDRAITFYSNVLGSPLEKQEYPGCAMAIFPHEGEKVGGCLYAAEEGKPSADGPLIYLNASGRLDDAIAAVEPHGGKVLKPKHAIGPYGYRAVVLDSEGNRVALHSQ